MRERLAVATSPPFLEGLEGAALARGLRGQVEMMTAPLQWLSLPSFCPEVSPGGFAWNLDECS